MEYNEKLCVSGSKQFIKGKTIRKIPTSQWRGYYNIIIPDGSWELKYIEQTETKSIQIYEKEGIIIRFEFKGDYEDITSVIEYM